MREFEANEQLVSAVAGTIAKVDTLLSKITVKPKDYDRGVFSDIGGVEKKAVEIMEHEMNHYNPESNQYTPDLQQVDEVIKNSMDREINNPTNFNELDRLYQIHNIGSKKNRYNPTKFGVESNLGDTLKSRVNQRKNIRRFYKYMRR